MKTVKELDKLFSRIHTKTVRRLIVFLVILFVFLYVTHPSQAIRKEVLSAEDLSIPPTVEGPGILLPDNPFYFLDQFKQRIRLILAPDFQTRARIYHAIAGERMAELRFMLARENGLAARENLIAISDNFKQAAYEVEMAKLSGQDVSKLAKEINDSIKEKQRVFDELELSAAGEMRAQIKTSSEGLTSAKKRVEEGLSEPDLINELRDDIVRETELDLREASTSATQLKKTLEELQKQQKEADEQALKRREELLKKAIEEKNQEMVRQEEKALTQERQRTTQAAQLGESAIEEAAKIMERARVTAEKYSEIKSSSQ